MGGGDHERLRQEIGLLLEMGKTVEKVTMAKVAEKAGVSKATVSRALGGSMLIGEDVRSHVEAIAHELGYIRRSQKRHAERSILTIKLVLPPAKERSTQLFYNFTTLADGLREGLLPSVANLIVETSSDDYRPFPHKKGGEVDGFVFAFHRPSSCVVDEIQETGAACVVLNRMVRGVRHVVSDHHDAMKQLAGHLAGCGVRGGCCYVYYGGFGDLTRARLNGFAEGCLEHGIEFDPPADQSKVEGPSGITTDHVKELYDRGVRTFVGFNDVVGIILMQQLRSLGLQIPGEVKVTGCDCGPIHEISHPKLTSVDLSIFKLAREVGRSLQSEIVEREKTANVLLIRGALLVGETT
jgi:LacI family transcriptional regulator